MKVVICNDTKENFSWEPEIMNVKFHKNGENTGKILKMSCVRSNIVNFDIFLGSHKKFSLVFIIITGRLITSLTLEKECNML